MTMIDGIIDSDWAFCLLCLGFFYLFFLLGCFICFSESLESFTRSNKTSKIFLLENMSEVALGG